MWNEILLEGRMSPENESNIPCSFSHKAETQSSGEKKGRTQQSWGITSAETIFINHFLFGNNWRVVYLREGESFLFNQLELTQKYH